MMQLTAEAIEQARSNSTLGRSAMVFDRVTSTNDLALAQAAAGAAEGLIILAEEQSAGRGRLGRSWHAPAGGGLLFSLLFRPHLPLRLGAQVTMCVGLGVVEGVEAVTGLRPMLKWPNDMMLNGLKLGGMLTETDLTGEQLSSVVVGVGLNINMDLQLVREEWAGSATSLLNALGERVDRLALLLSILERTEHWYDCLQGLGDHEEAGGPQVFRAWASRLDTLGRAVEVALPAGPLRGVAVSASSEGALRVQTPDGALVEVWSGDVRQLRISPR